MAKIRYDQLFGQSSTPAALLAIDAEHGMGAIGLLDPDTNHPEITLHMAPLCDVPHRSWRKVLDASEPIQVRLRSEMGTMLLITTLSDAHSSATAGRCLQLVAFNASAERRSVEFTVKADQPDWLDPIELEPTRLATLIDHPAPS